MESENIPTEMSEVSDFLMDIAADVICCNESVWVVLERIVDQEHIKEQAVLSLVAKTLKEITERLNKFEEVQLRK